MTQSKSKQDADMGPVWSQLREPFTDADLETFDHRAGFNSKHETAKLRLSRSALRHRLDSVVGPNGWHVEYDYLGENLYKCRLTILGVVREGVYRDTWVDSATHESLLVAAAEFGIAPKLLEHPTVFLEWKEGRRPTNIDALRNELVEMGILD